MEDRDAVEEVSDEAAGVNEQAVMKDSEDSGGTGRAASPTASLTLLIVVPATVRSSALLRWACRRASCRRGGIPVPVHEPHPLEAAEALDRRQPPRPP